MNFKPGDKVWIYNPPGGRYPTGMYAGILVALQIGKAPNAPEDNPISGWWTADIESIPPINGYPWAHESQMRRRDDPPAPPEKEALGEWDLCPWSPPKKVTAS